MPVLPHEVHEKTVLTRQYYGCYNYDRGALAEYYAPTRIYNEDGSFYIGSKLVEVHNSLECRYDHSLNDPRCNDCKHRGSGERYAQETARKGNA